MWHVCGGEAGEHQRLHTVVWIKERKVDQTQVRGPFQCWQFQLTASLLSIFPCLKTIKYHMASNLVISSLFPPFLLPCLSHTYLLFFHYIPSPLFFPPLYCICPVPSLSPYQEVTEWFRSTAQSLSAKGHEQPFPFLESACHSLISFNSVIPSFAGGGSSVGRRQHSLMLLSLLQRILLSPRLSVRVPYLAISHMDNKSFYVTYAALWWFLQCWLDGLVYCTECAEVCLSVHMYCMSVKEHHSLNMLSHTPLMKEASHAG